MKQLKLLTEIVKKDNKLVRSRLNITNVDGSRILASLIAQIRKDKEVFEDTYILHVKDILPETSGGQTYGRIKKICKELSNTTAEIEEIRPDKENNSLTIYTFFSYIKYEKGVITARFNQDVRPFLLGLQECFTQYNLIEYISLPSFYSQRIFEILKSWSNLPDKTITLHELHRMLSTPPSFRENFKTFRVRVLEKAYKDIHAHTSLTFEWLPIKSGHSVESIKFSFSDARKKITQKEVKKANEDKQRRLQNQRMLKALSCSTEKKGECAIQDNRPIICKICNQLDICEDVRKNNKNMLSLL